MVTLDVDGRRAVDICDAVERAVRDGQLAPGDQLPTVRELAGSLGVSPTTVAAAYRQLRQRSVISTHGRGGTRVHRRPPLDVPVDDVLPDGVRDLRALAPDPAILPRRGDALASLPTNGSLPEESALLIELVGKDLLADEIPVRGLAIAADGATALRQLLAAALRPGDRVLIEDPADPVVRDVLTAEGYQVVPLPLDARGIRPDRLRDAARSTVAALVVTPRGQDPAAVAFDQDRRAALRAVLDSQPDLLVVERDPLGPVSGVNYRTLADGHRERWAVLRSYAAAFGPDLDLTVVAGDDGTVSRTRGRLALTGGRAAPIVQALCGELLADAETNRTISLAARTYGARRVTFLAELRNRGILAQGLSGLHVWVPVDDEATVVRGLRGRGWAVTAGDRFSVESPPGVRIGTATLSTDEARRLADDLLEVLAA